MCALLIYAAIIDVDGEKYRNKRKKLRKLILRSRRVRTRHFWFLILHTSELKTEKNNLKTQKRHKVHIFVRREKVEVSSFRFHLSRFSLLLIDHLQRTLKSDVLHRIHIRWDINITAASERLSHHKLNNVQESVAWRWEEKKKLTMIKTARANDRLVARSDNEDDYS